MLVLHLINVIVFFVFQKILFFYSTYTNKIPEYVWLWDTGCMAAKANGGTSQHIHGIGQEVYYRHHCKK